MLEKLDKKQKTELIITVIGILFLILLISSSIKKAHIKKGVTLIQSIENAPVIEPVSMAQGYTTTQKWGNDPFYPNTSFAGTVSGLAGYVLNGIVWDAENPYAIINSEIVKVGDNLDETTTVVEITENSAKLQQGEESYTIELNTF